MNSAPLEGIRVVDVSRGLAGTRAGGFLADYGADVVWIEPPGGDPYRDAAEAAYSVFNRGKRSVELDLASASDRNRLLDLLATADVFLQSWRPSVAEDFGLDYETLHDAHPSLIYASIDGGFDPAGPYGDLPGFESFAHAHVGTTSLDQTMMNPVPGGFTEPSDAPVFQGLPYASIGASYLAVLGTLAALYRRQHDGVGRQIETSLLDGALAYLAMYWADFADEEDGDRYPEGAGLRTVIDDFECQDGGYISINTLAEGAFGRMMAEVGLDDKIPPTDAVPELADLLDADQIAVLEEELPAVFKTAPRDEWVERLVDADVCALPVLPPTTVFDRPQPQHNNMIVEVDDPTLGPVEQVAPPIKFGDLTATTDPDPAPEPGEHTEDVLGGEADDAGGDQPAVGEAPSSDLLSGVKVVDFGSFVAGPFASGLLADLGADVIAVEQHTGDPLRGQGAVFQASLSGKRGIALDMKADAGREIAEELIGWADAVHHNMRPGVAERLGISFEDAKRINPEVIYLHAPGWGSSGPESGRQSFAPKMSGYSGVNYEIAGEGNPPIPPQPNEDIGNGILGAIAMLMALHSRQTDGSGTESDGSTATYLECPQLHAAMAQMSHVVRDDAGTPVGAGRLASDRMGTGPLNRLYETADGWISLTAPRDEHVDGLGDVLGIDLLADDRFDSRKARAENAAALVELVGDACRDAPTDDLLTALHDAGVPAVERLTDNKANFLTDAYNQEIGRTATADHPEKGPMTTYGRLIRSSHVTPADHRPAPELGEHTDEVLADLGYDDGHIADLHADEVVK